jgi:hypothetical protein
VGLTTLHCKNLICYKNNTGASDEVEGKEQYNVDVSNRFAALEDLDTEMEMNSAQKTIRIKKFQPKGV